MNLYEINEHLKKVIEEGFSVDEETGEILFDEENLNELKEAFVDKIDGIACYIKSLNAKAEAIKKEMDNLKARKEACERKADKLKDYIANNLKVVDMDGIETTRNKIGFRKSTSVKVNDPSLVPYKFRQTETVYKIDKKEILKNLRDGIVVEGCELEVKSNLQIK